VLGYVTNVRLLKAGHMSEQKMFITLLHKITTATRLSFWSHPWNRSLETNNH
jgi:hypothetical protein